MDVKVYDKKSYLEVILDADDAFNLEHILECGQCFRWRKELDGSYSGVAFEKLINIRQKEKHLEIRNASEAEFWEIWYDYFDLGRDYQSIKETISNMDCSMKKAVDYGYGIRLLNQEPWEALISFIISQNRNIPAIKKSIELICERYGVFLGEFAGQSYYAFPKPEDLAGLSIEALMETKVGYRAPYIIESAKKIVNEKIDLDDLKKRDTAISREILLSFHGIGPKVADCILLFSMEKYEVFPTDVWIKRIIESLYYEKSACVKNVNQFAQMKFGDLSGFAQQYLFFYAKEKGIGKKK